MVTFKHVPVLFFFFVNRVASMRLLNLCCHIFTVLVILLLQTMQRNVKELGIYMIWCRKSNKHIFVSPTGDTATPQRPFSILRINDLY